MTDTKLETFDDLLVEHDYYCSLYNYHVPGETEKFETWQDFYEEFGDADVDMNLVVRWDIKKGEKQGDFYMNVFILQQRKGDFYPVIINHVNKNDYTSIKKYLSIHFEKIKNIWMPFSDSL